MKKESLIVPNGIRYIGDWKGYSLESYKFPHILNKTLTGCGYTEYCIRNPLNVILCSPRKILLQNKEDQHPGEVYYVRNDIENTVDFEKDLVSQVIPRVKRFVLSPPKEKVEAEKREKERKIKELKDNIRKYYTTCRDTPNKPCKLLVTYDSFRHVREALGDDIKDFYVVIDEMQSIFTDAKFKSNTELEFVDQVQGLDRVCFVSATPMLTKYLDMLDYFKDLPYYELDWKTEEPGRVGKPHINVKYVGTKNTIQSEIKKVVEKYRKGATEVYRYKDANGQLQEIKSEEAVIYVNSVTDITKAIKLNKLSYSECNVLCANTEKNATKIRRALGVKKSQVQEPLLGAIPKFGEPHKMFTFCTRTVYLGADFYSTNARSFIFSNANIDCLTVDISMDLPQILGRQRLSTNPWQKCADLYVTLRDRVKTKKEFEDMMKVKERKTKDLLEIYTDISYKEKKETLAEKYEKDAKNSNYKDDYVAVNNHAGCNKLPVYNNLMKVADLRTHDMQDIDYADRVTILNRVKEEHDVNTKKDKIDRVISDFNWKFNTFVDKMKFLCELKDTMTGEEFDAVLELVPMTFRNYITTLGIDGIKANSYLGSRLDQEFKKLSSNQSVEDLVKDQVLQEFKPGEKYSSAEIKERLEKIYEASGYKKTPKATDIKYWLSAKDAQWRDKDGKKIHGFEIE